MQTSNEINPFSRVPTEHHVVRLFMSYDIFDVENSYDPLASVHDCVFATEEGYRNRLLLQDIYTFVEWTEEQKYPKEMDITIHFKALHLL